MRPSVARTLGAEGAAARASHADGNLPEIRGSALRYKYVRRMRKTTEAGKGDGDALASAPEWDYDGSVGEGLCPGPRAQPAVDSRRDHA